MFYFLLFFNLIGKKIELKMQNATSNTGNIYKTAIPSPLKNSPKYVKYSLINFSFALYLQL